jgi:hypothetical protein
MKRTNVSLFLAAALMAAFGPAAHAQVVLSRSVLGSGGSPSTGSVSSNGTIGQPVIGLSLSPTKYAWHGIWMGGILGTSGVDDHVIGLPDPPREFAFGLPAPNPMRGAARFEISLPAPGSVRLLVVDVSGRLVAVAHEGRLDAGRQTLSWDGHDTRGRLLPDGVYYTMLEVNGRPAGRRTIVVLR